MPWSPLRPASPRASPPLPSRTTAGRARQPRAAPAAARPRAPGAAPPQLGDRVRDRPRASSRATAGCYVFMPPLRTRRGLPRAGRRDRGHGRRARHAGRSSKATRRPTIRGSTLHQGHARPRRDRGQHPPGPQLGRAGRRSPTALYEEARADAARHREVHARRPPHRHRRRQPLRARRRDAGRQPVPAPARPAAQPGRLLAQPSVAVATCSPACSSARPARRRASTRRATTSSTSWRSPSHRSPEPGAGTCPPWLVDRIFRNLLVDVTGNTHRAEFCIDKLYSPDGPTGRLGLLELRAFEMPPHARMSLAQQLLLRALVARFWDSPYRRAAVRWGTELHDRFMLPHFVWRDFDDVIAELRGAGFPFEADWFAPHFEFRFPRIRRRRPSRRRPRAARTRSSPGTCWARKARPAARRATSTRSLERLQVQGRAASSAAATSSPATAAPCRCSRPARAASSWPACAIRAWQPPACLHPTIPVARAARLRPGRHLDRPLAGRLHLPRRAPGGRNYETLPVNA